MPIQQWAIAQPEGPLWKTAMLRRAGTEPSDPQGRDHGINRAFAILDHQCMARARNHL